VRMAISPARGGPRWGRLTRLQSRYPVLQVLAVVILFLYGSAAIDGFSSQQSIYSMLLLASLLGIAAIGQTLVVLIGGLDLSIPGFIVMGGVLSAELSGEYHWSFVFVVVLIAGLALVLGSASGFICHRFGIQPLIVTLAMSGLVAGGAAAWTQGTVEGATPAWLSRFTSPLGTVFGIQFPPLVALWLLLAIVIGVILRRTIAGHWINATGANQRAADFAQVPTRRVWTVVFALSACFSACAGIIVAGFGGSADFNSGDPYLFESIAAVIVGGTALGVGGDYWRTVIGALLLTEITTILVGQGYGEADTEILYGALIFLVVGGYTRVPRLRDRL
jgi:ribose transport system permease protein